jgi:sacsin
MIDDGLAEHQGPALLVYNNAVFQEDDFNSLLRLGDSVKMQNKLATGKFGLGFNSVSPLFSS